MDEVEGWIKLLVTYGPFALLVFFVFVTEAKARSAVAEAEGDGKRIMLAIYVANWVVIFSLVVVAIWAWKLVNLRAEHVIQGKLEDLRGSDVVVTDNSDLYLSRTYLPGGRIDYKWRLVSDAPLPAGTRIPVFFQWLERHGDRTEERVDVFELEVRPEFYDRPVVIRYDRASRQLLLIEDGTVTPLPAQSTPDEPPAGPLDEEPPRAMRFIIPSAYAAEPLDLKNLDERLEAYDPIVRRRAQQALGRAGARGAAEAAKLLARSTTNRDVLLAALRALNGTEELPAEAMTPAALDGVVSALTHRASDVRRAARRFAARHRSPELAARLDRRIEQHRARGERIPKGKVAILALVQLDLLYNLGIEEKDRYGVERGRDPALLDGALARFDRAWSLRELVVETDRARFAKALWGRALALHDRSWLERGADGGRNPDLTTEAVVAFQAFLDAVERLGPERYAYAAHLPTARAYIATPEPDSLLGRWFVIAGSFWKKQRAQAEEVVARLADRGFSAQVTDTDGYPNLRDGLWAVTIGPSSEERAREFQARVKEVVPDAYIKAGW